MIANPFANIELKIPKALQEDANRFAGMRRNEAGETRDIDKVPFRRIVDLWWAALCLGVQEGRQTEADGHKFNTGVVFNDDPWRIRHLQALAIGISGDPGILKDPGKIIAMANGFVATGVPILCEHMANPSKQPIWLATELLIDRIEDNS